MIRTLKKSVGFLTRLTINHAIRSATKKRPSTDKKAGRCRLRSASAEVDSVRASTASAKSLRRRGGHFSPPRTSPIRLLAGGRLPRRLNEIRLRPGRQQGLQVTADALVDREQRSGAVGAGQVAVLVQLEAADQAVLDVGLVDLVDHGRSGAIRLVDRAQEHLGRLGTEDRVRIDRLAAELALEAVDELQRGALVLVDPDAGDAEERAVGVRRAALRTLEDRVRREPVGKHQQDLAVRPEDGNLVVDQLAAVLIDQPA